MYSSVLLIVGFTQEGTSQRKATGTFSATLEMALVRSRLTISLSQFSARHATRRHL